MSLVVPAVARAQAPTAGSDVKVTPAPPPESLPVAGAPQPPLAPPPPAPEPPPPAPERRRRRAPAPPAEAKPPNPAAGYVPGTGFVIQSPDLNFRMRIGLVGGYKFEPDLCRRRVAAAQHLLRAAPLSGRQLLPDWIHFWTSFEFAANPPYLLDSYVEFAPSKLFTLRVGQQWTPFDRHEYFGPQGDPVPRVGARQRVLLVGPRQGLHRAGHAGRAARLLPGRLFRHAAASVQRAAGQLRARGALHLEPARSHGRDRVPVHRLRGARAVPRVGDAAGLLRQGAERDGELQPVDVPLRNRGDRRNDAPGRGRRGLLAAEAWLYFYVDGFVRRTEPSMAARYTSVGAWGQVGVPLVPKTLDIATRFNWLDASIDVGDDDFYSIEGQLAYYVSHTQGLVVKLRYAAGHQSSPGVAALGDVPLITTPGWTQLGTLQLNIAL